MFRIFTESTISRDISVSVFEDEDTCFVDFDGDLGMLGVGTDGVVDVGFFAC